MHVVADEGLASLEADLGPGEGDASHLGCAGRATRGADREAGDDLGVESDLGFAAADGGDDGGAVGGRGGGLRQESQRGLHARTPIGIAPVGLSDSS